MRLNADLSKRAVVHGLRTRWTTSPIPGVERRMLDRLGAEVARATSIVRYAPKSVFPSHTHDGGEEFFVIEGVFEDELGEYPAGTYVRNPPASHHAPRSELGCTIFVKLRQFNLNDRTHVRMDTRSMSSLPDPYRLGVEIVPIFQNSSEDVRLEIWSPAAEVAIGEQDGIEIFVLEGGFIVDGEAFETESWLRMPADAFATCTAGRSGCKLWVKSGHLARVPRHPS